MNPNDKKPSKPYTPWTSYASKNDQDATIADLRKSMNKGVDPYAHLPKKKPPKKRVWRD